MLLPPTDWAPEQGLAHLRCSSSQHMLLGLQGTGWICVLPTSLWCKVGSIPAPDLMGSVCLMQSHAEDPCAWSSNPWHPQDRAWGG